MREKKLFLCPEWDATAEIWTPKVQIFYVDDNGAHGEETRTSTTRFDTAQEASAAGFELAVEFLRSRNARGLDLPDPERPSERP